ncbi:MAG: DUF2339 domain-containing protein [Chthoniobacterales bacterium]
MEQLLSCGFIGLTALVLLALALTLRQRGRLSTLEAMVKTLTQRLHKLEASEMKAAPIPATSAQLPAAVPSASAGQTPPPLPIAASVAKPIPPPVAKAPAKPLVPAIDWEAFMGVKLFAWLGGFVLFLGVVFLVKYSFENNLITPVMRVVLGGLVGLGLIAGGWFTAVRNYRVPGQSLAATGVLVLYADIFSAHAFYGLVGLPLAFLMMSGVTLAAFLLAMILDAQTVVVLGLLGGFLTPPLLDTGADQPALLFGYVALLNFGVAAVALRKKWDYLLLLAAIGTVVMEVAWLPWGGGNGARVAAGFFIFLGLQAQFVAFAYLRQRQEPAEKWSTPAALMLGLASLAFGFFLLGYRSLALRPGFFFGFNFLADIGLLTLAFRRPNPSRIAAATGAIVFVTLSTWTGWYLKEELLWWALGAYVIFAVIHAGFSVWPPRASTSAMDRGWRVCVPLLALGLLFTCVLGGQTSFAVWVCVLLIDLIALGLALTSRSVAALLVALLATLATAGLWIATAPPLPASIGGMLSVVGGFGVFFSVAASFLTRRLAVGSEDKRRHVPALAAAMPFVLLIMLIGKLPVGDPMAVFAVAMVLGIVLLGLGILARTSWIALVALGCTFAVESEWHALHFTNTHAALALGWYGAFLLLFAAYPYFSAEERSPLPWAIGALSGFFHFWLVIDLVTSAYPRFRNGLLPAVFILPYAFGVYHLIRKRGIAPASGDARLAWQGGAALFFLSLIFPIQFHQEWITLGWAVEGLALLLLFRVVPNNGLRWVGAALLALAFVRLALNPAVLNYHPRSQWPIWNWYLYSYGVVCVCIFAGARALRSAPDTLAGHYIPRVLYLLGAVLTFLLMNVEIADYFSVGPTLTFSFEGNFARDMSYSIAWALFAFVLLLIGMRQKTKWVRYAGLALLLVTLAKLFLHDFASLGQLYRIGAFIGVALILIVASFVYQRFLAPTVTAEE